MLATDSIVEKSFELWPGVLRFAATGEGAHAAIDAGMDAARDISLNLLADAELIASAASSDILPRGAAGRLVLEALRASMQATGAASLADGPPPLVALPGAVCDIVLAAMREGGNCEAVVVSLGDAAAFEAGEKGVPAGGPVPSVIGEFLRALGAGQAGGVALAGLRSHLPTAGAVDRVLVHAKSAAAAMLAAAHVANAASASGALRKSRLPDPLVARAFEGRRIAGEPGLLPPEAIWDALSAGLRRASALREKRLLRACVLGLKGRGRTLGPIDGDRLLRFGVSEWR